MDLSLFSLTETVSWFTLLNQAEKLGVVGFLLVALLYIILIICGITGLFARKKEMANLHFIIEDVKHEMFKKKGFVLFDLYIRNTGSTPVEILQTGFVLSDGSKRAIYSEPHQLKLPDHTILLPGQEAFYDNCDLFYALNENGVSYKKITGMFADVKNGKRFYGKTDINPILNDQTIRSILTDQKGLNGF
ncbi:MAG: hypothetical protein GX933_05820 [Chloroflexi bacterium]|nr:hypothetical protein [Chloroflexota bacterium]